MESRADLHIHTRASDGTDTPEYILARAEQIGLEALSFTDHDTRGAYSKSTLDVARSKGITLLPGVELSTETSGHSIHVLIYGPGILDGGVDALLDQNLSMREHRNTKILEMLKHQGIEIDPEELRRVTSGVIGRPAIAQILVQQGVVKNLESAFQRYLRDDLIKHTIEKRVQTEDALKMIREIPNCVAILAHPHLIKRKRLLKRCLELDFDGLEAYYAFFSHEENEKWASVAQEKQWLLTGGSDYHGELIKKNRLGSSYTNEDDLIRLLERVYG